MMRFIILYALVLTSFVPSAVIAKSGEIIYQFDKYSEKVENSSRSVKVRIVTAKDRKYASVLREAASAKADFAGHYILASWGCGASCVVSAAIDTKDGSVHWFPYTVCCWRIDITEPLEYKVNSKLLITHGKLNETGKDDDRYFEFLNGRFGLLQRDGSMP